MLVFEEKGKLDSLLKHCMKKASQTSKHILREDTQRTLLKQPSQNLLLKNQALPQKQKQNKKILAFVMQYHPVVPNLKPILMKSWHFTTQQPLLNNIFKEPQLISYKRGLSLNIVVRAKL